MMYTNKFGDIMKRGMGSWTVGEFDYVLGVLKGIVKNGGGKEIYEFYEDLLDIRQTWFG